ncbi:VanZ family protein [Flavobacterium sp. J49]|uniref:VanZ family protein n=1 Tax=Flavobacterium sp. J49 TaxID=2718534 RepID=UPI0015943202|nr:VanZ family protein [Flavobacterium sp. J49]MBF6641159.1 VanZ family protein [Flavobacterium sp. J49]NIC02406.1 VanZ family protein [Flavobacterium sp. J49]
MPKIKVSGFDKYGHFIFHFVFTMLWGYYAWLKQHSLTYKKLAAIVVVSIFYGILIEFLQETCTQTRQADPLDVLANFIGAMTAFLVLVFLNKRKKI